MCLEDQKEIAKKEISEVLNATGAYRQIDDIALVRFDTTIDRDSQFWCDIEDFIVNRMVQEMEEMVELDGE